MEELVIDFFAGGGGASEGIARAIGRDPDIAVNHSAAAIAMHRANHPRTHHYLEEVWKVNPVEACGGRRVGFMWMSPDCTHHSRARGGKPKEGKKRALAWLAIRWAKAFPKGRRPRVIVLENVEEFLTWGPLDASGQPIKEKAGRTFRMFVGRLRGLGYRVEYRVLCAADYGAPTTRKRLFMIARCDGQPIVWPQPTHGKTTGQPWRSAASIIDWSLPCPSIFDRKKPLAEATLRRIAAGLKRYVLDAASPFIVPVRTVTTTKRGEFALVTPYLSSQYGQSVGRGVDDPFPTVTGGYGGHHALIAPTLIRTDNQSDGRLRGVASVEKPLRTVTSAGGIAVVTPYLMTNTSGHPGRSVEEPVPTVTTGDHHYLCAPYLARAAHGEVSKDGTKRWGNGHHDIAAPIGTVCGSNDFAVVTPFLAKYHGGEGKNPLRGQSADEPLRTIDTENRFALIAPTLVQTGYSEREGQKPRALDIEKPLGTVVSGGKHGLVTAFISRHFGGGCTAPARDAQLPLPTVTGRDHHALTTATLAPAPDRREDVRAFLLKFYSSSGSAQSQQQSLFDPLHTVTSKARFGLVYVHGVAYEIVDIGMRMLAPHELFAAQGFPADYILTPEHKGRPLTKTEQIELAGNSVCPPLAEALVRANYAPTQRKQEVA